MARRRGMSKARWIREIWLRLLPPVVNGGAR